MRHRHIIIALALLVIAACTPMAKPGNNQAAYQPIRPVSDCLDLGRNPEIYIPGDTSIIVKTGPRHFRIDLANKCGNLNAATLSFKLASGNRASRRLCGELGDQVINSNGLRCNIRRVTPIDKAEFNRLQALSKARR